LWWIKKHINIKSQAVFAAWLLLLIYGMKKPCRNYRDLSFRISISKRFKDKGFICIVHFFYG